MPKKKIVKTKKKIKDFHVSSGKKKIKEIKSKVKVREIKSDWHTRRLGKERLKEIGSDTHHLRKGRESKKKPKKIGEDLEEVIDKSELNKSFQTIKAPVLEKIAHSEEQNLEQIAFTKEKEREEDIKYLDIKSDYTDSGKAEDDGRSKYMEVSVNYETSENKREDHGYTPANTLVDQEESKKRKGEDWRFESKAEDKKYETKRL